jgi:hypothetical protein
MDSLIIIRRFHFLFLEIISLGRERYLDFPDFWKDMSMKMKRLRKKDTLFSIWEDNIVKNDFLKSL